VVAVEGDELAIGSGRFKIRVDKAGCVVEVAGWTLANFAPELGAVFWESANGPKHGKCLWTRQGGPKRERVASATALEAERDEGEVDHFMRHSSQMRPVYANADGTYGKPNAHLVPSGSARPKVEISDAELARLNKDMQKRFAPAKDPELRSGYSSSSSRRSGSGGGGRKPGFLHLEPHVAAEWAGWERLVPHTVFYAAMKKMAKASFPAAVEGKGPKPAALGLPKPTPESLEDSYRCTKFLSNNKAWPTIKEGMMHDFVASKGMATYVSRAPGSGQIEAAVVLLIAREGDRRVCWVEFIRMDKTVDPPGDKPVAISKGKKSPPMRPIPAFMTALKAKLGPIFDKLVLQVHSNNAHAHNRFVESYGFSLDPNYDERWKQGSREYQLYGMSQRPTGKMLEVAKARREEERIKHEKLMQEEKKAAEERSKKAKIDADALVLARPRRAAAQVITSYEETDDLPPVTAADFC